MVHPEKEVQPVPPLALQEECKKINDDFLQSVPKAYVEPYTMDTDFGFEWRIRLVWEHGSVGFFCPGSVDSHGFYLMACALMQTHKNGIEEGKLRTVASIVRNLGYMVSVDAKDIGAAISPKQ
jgi:hypothetical protein